MSARSMVTRWGTLLMLLFMLAPPARPHGDDEMVERFNVMVRRNLDHDLVLSSATIDSVMQTMAGKSLGERTAAWARYFLERGDVQYLYGRAEGGYVSRGLLALDYATDCVLFMYRTTELARSTTAEEAIQFAFGTRFYGASVEHAVKDDGRVDYDDPAVLQFAEDMLKSGVWGRDVTAECGSTTLDAVGSSRVPADTLSYLPTNNIAYERLEPGDIVWFVGDENRPGALEERVKGTLIHHLGIIARENGEAMLIHPASIPMPGEYEQTGVARVPLRTYLTRVGKFKGVLVTRLVEF
ncbi:MAG: hypothetical protein IPK72_19320 [Candidatus Eisenbacteria bacterium]|nr:hypothetical protein [Candidatus Eisenbacteria bacterium]